MDYCASLLRKFGLKPDIGSNPIPIAKFIANLISVLSIISKMSKQFDQEEFLSKIREETEKVLSAVAQLNQKFLALEGRIDRCEKELNRLDKRTRNEITLH